MNRFIGASAQCAALVVFALGTGAPFERASAESDGVVYSFTGGSDGASPAGGLIADNAGNLYGTSFGGGSAGHGDVYKLTPGGSITVLYSFSGKRDGGSPQSTLLADAKGNLYGTTSEGGAANQGTVFKLAPNGKETVLHAFKGGYKDGAYPQAGLIVDSDGIFYGTTQVGGSSGSCGGGCGIVFRISAAGKFALLYSFGGSPDGAYPTGALVEDAQGNLYGTTEGGGIQSNYCGIGCGTAFELSPRKKRWVETVIHLFVGGGTDGINPYAGLITDGAGNFFGTTTLGGNIADCIVDAGCGSVFEISPAGHGAWTENVLYAFQGGSDGATPYAGLIRDNAGNLYGATFEGGLNDCPFSSGCGTVFKLAPNGAETILHAFSGVPSDGANSQANLFADGKGNLYGTTDQGGATQGCFESQGCGTVFVLQE
jgi:uncharacterized repeat protein (TIGR03803 family)